MSDPVIKTCSGTSWACAIWACATCCACAARAFVNVSNDAEPMRVASLDVVGFMVLPPCRRLEFCMIEYPPRLLDGYPHATRYEPSFPQKPQSPDLDLKLTRRCLCRRAKTPHIFVSRRNSRCDEFHLSNRRQFHGRAAAGGWPEAESPGGSPRISAPPSRVPTDHTLVGLITRCSDICRRFQIYLRTIYSKEPASGAA